MKLKVIPTLSFIVILLWCFGGFYLQMSAALASESLGSAPNERVQSTPGDSVLTWGGMDWFEAGGVAVDGSGNIYIAGRFKGTVDFDPGPGSLKRSSISYWYDSYLVKLDASGTLQWAKTWGGVAWDEASGVAVDDAGDVYIAGAFQSKADLDPGPENRVYESISRWFDAYLIKLDSNGGLLWVRTWGDLFWEKAKGVAVDASGGIYIAGVFKGRTDLDPGEGKFRLTSQGGSDSCLIKLDASGAFEWAKTWGGESWDEASSVAVDDSGNIYVAGFFEDAADLDPGDGSVIFESLLSNYDCYLIKLDASGAFLWAKTWGGRDLDSANGVAVDSAGNIYITGYFSDLADLDPNASTKILDAMGPIGPFLIKLDPSEILQWAKTWGGMDWDAATGVTVDAGGRVYVVGSFFGTSDFDPGLGEITRTSLGRYNAFLLRLDGDGELAMSINIT